MDLAFAADDSGTAVTTGKNVLPDYPDENPTKSALKAWLDAWRDELRATGYSSLLRGEEPYAMAKLAPRPLISVETGTIPDSIRAENARIEHQNALNLIEKEGQLRELQNRLAGKLERSLRPKAPLKLERLLQKHKHKEPDGTVVEKSHDGVALFLELEAEENKDVAEYDQKKYTSYYERLRDKPLPDNCPPQAFSKRLNTFARHVNPYLEIPLTGERLGKFILSQLPSSLGSESLNAQKAVSTRSGIP